MIPVLRLSNDADRRRVESLLGRLRLDPRDLALSRGERAQRVATVQAILADVAERGDAAIVDSARKFDDPNFSAAQIRVSETEMRDAASRVPPEQLAAVRRSIAQVKQYQVHILPESPRPLMRQGVQLGLRFTPVESAGLYFPGGKASYPSSLIMLTVPAQVAGVKRIVVCTPPSKDGRSDLVLAACHELGLTDVFRAGGAAAIAAMAFGTATIPAVDKIVGPGNEYVQLAKRALAGCVGIDSFLGPSEILVLADETGRAPFIAADMIAQAEHDPGSCFLLTTSEQLARDVVGELTPQAGKLDRNAAIEKSFAQTSAIVIDPSMDRLIELANRFAAEHVSLQTRDDLGTLKRVTNAGCIFVGPWSPVAAGDYVAGPSHCLPTNTTARFSSGVSVYEFLKRSSVAHYDQRALTIEGPHIIALAEAEGLEGHAASVRARGV
jgi:histidinol dehydrogenase